jgi:uncharacterized protein YprB with RNaseH-like and TPR domain
MGVPFPIPRIFPLSLGIIINDLFRYGSIPNPENLVFFDLETTGLSGGAGTLAFLASFGSFKAGGLTDDGLIIKQYLLLDYPGEGDFIEALKAELQKPGPNSLPQLVVTYNGKTFDSQIFKNRCLMNAVVPPDYFHADLLHPSRRLWKRLLIDCSQGTIETNILGLDRTGDTPGALAPEIWFSFLKSGDPSELTGICEHNLRDIRGLASLMLLLGKIAAAPLETLDTFRFDLESLALLWYKKDPVSAASLLREAAERQMPRALYTYALDLLKTKDKEKARHNLLTLASLSSTPLDLKAAVYRSLAIDAEWQERDFHLALAHTESALTLPGIKKSLAEELERRRERLLKKALVC